MNVDYKSSVYEKKGFNYDFGLRKYMLSVYQYMGFALAITAIVAMFAASSEALMSMLVTSPLRWVVAFAPLVMVFYMSAKISTMSLEGCRIALGIFSGLMGLSLSYIFLVYTGESITRVFLITAATFGAMSIYGYQTKKDLSSMGSFLLMAVIGIVIASLVNMFLQSSAMQFALSVIGVIVFTLFTAYDTQRIKHIYYSVGGDETVAGKVAIYGALSLYMDFINLFISLLSILGVRKDN